MPQSYSGWEAEAAACFLRIARRGTRVMKPCVVGENICSGLLIVGVIPWVDQHGSGRFEILDVARHYMEAVF